MHVIIGGCGRVGAELAGRLSEEGHDVVVIDPEAGAFERLGSAFNGKAVVADITDRKDLLEAGIEQADALVAVTPQDNANLMAVQIAQELFGVPRTVARLFNPEREQSYRKMGVHYVSGTRLVAKAILNEIRVGAFPLHVSFDSGEVEVVEMSVTLEGHGITVGELERNGDVRVAAIQRGHRVKLPKPTETVLADDIVVAAVSRGAHRWLRGLMCGPAAEEAAALRRRRH
ncbi:MAG: potassium channel family protein [Egibacteraceae bacterium]